MPRWLPAAAVTFGAAVFAWMNRGERVVLNVGVATLYRVPFTAVLFLAFLAGMIAMLLLSLRHDLAVRRELRARGLLPAPAPGPQPAVSAWGVAPAAPAPRDDDDRTVSYPDYDDRTADETWAAEIAKVQDDLASDPAFSPHVDHASEPEPTPASANVAETNVPEMDAERADGRTAGAPRYGEPAP